MPNQKVGYCCTNFERVFFVSFWGNDGKWISEGMLNPGNHEDGEVGVYHACETLNPFV